MFTGRKILVPHNGLIHLISQDQILYCKADNCYTHLHLQSSKCFLLIKSLAKVTQELEPTYFIRVNQSYLINKHHIESIDKKAKTILMSNTDKIPFTIRIRELLELLSAD